GRGAMRHRLRRLGNGFPRPLQASPYDFPASCAGVGGARAYGPHPGFPPRIIQLAGTSELPSLHVGRREQTGSSQNPLISPGSHSLLSLRLLAISLTAASVGMRRTTSSLP